MRTSSPSVSLSTPSAAAVSKHALSRPGLAKGARWRRRSSDSFTFAVLSTSMPSGACQPSLSTAAPFSNAACVSPRAVWATSESTACASAAISLDVAELGANRLAGALAQALPQQREQDELAQRHAPVDLDHCSQVGKEGIARLLALLLDRGHRQVGERAACGDGRGRRRRRAVRQPGCASGRRAGPPAPRARPRASPRPARAQAQTSRAPPHRRAAAPRAAARAGGPAAAPRSRRARAAGCPIEATASTRRHTHGLDHIAGAVKHGDLGARAVPRGAVIVAHECEDGPAGCARRSADGSGTPTSAQRRWRRTCARTARWRRRGPWYARAARGSSPARRRCASGLRVNCTLAASASSSRSREIAALIAPAAKVPGKPMNAMSAAHSASTAPAPRSSRATRWFWSAAREHHGFAVSRRCTSSPASMPTRRRLSAHVAVQDVAELVPHHALQLVARELLERALRDHDHRLVRRMPGGERVDARRSPSST